MNKNDVVRSIASATKLTQKDSLSFVTALVNVVTEALKNGEEVNLVGFGKWTVRKRAARVGVNPKSQEKINIAARKVPAFKCGKNLKEAVNS